MIELLMLKKSNHLAPVDTIGMEALQQLANGTTVTVRMTQTRNLQHHRLWYALLQTVFEAQTTFATLDEMHDAIKIAIGYFEAQHTLSGEVYYHPKSISFAKMDQPSFRQFFDRAVDVVISRILPAANRIELEQQVYSILGEPGPCDLQRIAG